MNDLTNSTVKQLIKDHYRSDTDKSVITDRFINVMPFEKILDNNFPEMVGQSEKARRRFISKKIIPLCNKFDKAIASVK